MSKRIVAIDKELKKYMQMIIDNGYECYLVGGAVRDYLIDCNIKDYDFCTNIPFEKLKQLIPGIIVMKENNHRNTAVIRINGFDIEFSTYKGKSLEKDLFNRDFTINAVAVDIDGKIIDYYNGVNDINKKTISLVETSGVGFVNDPLRILRAIRLALKYNFEINANTKKTNVS